MRPSERFAGEGIRLWNPREVEVEELGKNQDLLIRKILLRGSQRVSQSWKRQTASSLVPHDLLKANCHLLAIWSL